MGREPEPPYNRPPCSKGYLQGEEEREDTYFRPPEWWEEQSIELMTRTSALKLDTEAREAKLSNKETVGFDKALIATGANVRRLNVDGSDLDGIHYLRALGNADSIRSDTEQAERVVLDRRLLHRHRGGGVADRAGEALHDPDAGGPHAGALASARRPGASSRACSRSTGSRCTAATAGALRGRRRPREQGRDRGRPASWRPTWW